MACFWLKFKKVIRYNAVTAIEFDEIEAEKSRNIGLANSQVIHSDFHDFCINTEQRFDLIVGNLLTYVINISIKNNSNSLLTFLEKQI